MIALRPFTDDDWMAFNGCESIDPLVCDELPVKLTSSEELMDQTFVTSLIVDGDHLTIWNADGEADWWLDCNMDSKKAALQAAKAIIGLVNEGIPMTERLLIEVFNFEPTGLLVYKKEVGDARAAQV